MVKKYRFWDSDNGCYMATGNGETKKQAVADLFEWFVSGLGNDESEKGHRKSYKNTNQKLACLKENDFVLEAMN